MESFTRNCEIVESNEDMRFIQSKRFTKVRTHHKEWQPPVPRKESYKPLEDDINKLFEGINIRTSKSLDLSDRLSTRYRRNASKMPMRVAPSNSPGIGFSEPVSLKQALRGLCISQAAEMAAMKRLSKPPGSPALSEAARTTNLYRSMIIESGESSLPLPEGRGEISLVPEESASSSMESGHKYHREPKCWSANPSAHSSPLVLKPTVKSLTSSPLNSFVPGASTKVESKSLGTGHTQEESYDHKIVSATQSTLPSPRLALQPNFKNKGSTQIVSMPKELQIQPVELMSKKEENQSGPVVPCHSAGDVASKLQKNTSCSNKVASSANRRIGTSIKVASKTTPKLRRKAKLQNLPSSTAIRSSKDLKESKSMRNTPRAVKPVMRNKNVLVKKVKQESLLAGVDPYKSSELSGVHDYSSNQMICLRCKCSLKDANKETSKDSMPPVHSNPSVILNTNSRNCHASNLNYMVKASEDCVTPTMKGNMTTKLREKGEFSHSSKSSIGDYSSSTSISEESNLSGSSFGNRPHMSKDFRWEAINHVRKQQGFLGLIHFNLLKKLGSGDIGTVYLAELVGTNCLFAIKVMDNEFLARRKKMPRAQTEREILRMLDHPFLPTLYAQFTSDNLSCLVMEFCPGGDLHVLRQKQPGRYFPEQAARFYVAEVLLALEYLHMLGIVYRDLKPENILVREDGHIMLTDFDLSLRCSVNPTLVNSHSLGIEPPRVSGPCAGSNCIDPFCAAPSCKVSCFSPRILPATVRTRKLKEVQAMQAKSLPQLVAEPTDARSNSFVGTHEYLAPEIIKGEGHGSAVDWWTFGVFLYELLYGKTPFKGAGNEETLANVVLQHLRFPDSPIVSFQARDLIRGLLVKEPENRLGTETGAAEIKRHPFFDGLNWALIRCAVPPQIPEFCDIGVPKIVSQEKGKRFLEYNATGEHLEFELF